MDHILQNGPTKIKTFDGKCKINEPSVDLSDSDYMNSIK